MKMSRTVLAVTTGWFLAGGMAGAEISRPAWLTDCSVNIKESYDNNVFLSGVNPGSLPPSYTVPSGSVAALKNEYSWITAISPKIGVNFSPLLGSPTNLPLLSLAYAPDLAVYHDQTSESYEAHRALAAVKVKTDPVSFSGDNAFSYVNGSDMGPVYPGGYYSAIATAAARERRKQIQDRGNVSVQFDQEKWFFRPTASLLYYDLMTEQINLPGYQNYCDRYDVNGGADVGYKITPKFAVTLGYRYGHQYQQQYSFSPYSSSSDYQRVLAGVEGNPCSWLNVKALSGPDFRDYEGDSAGHITPVNNHHPVKYYGEAQATATVTPDNAVTFRYKQWQWVSGSGKVPYSDGTYELAWHSQLAKPVGFDLGGKFSTWDFTSGNLSTCHRHDLLYAVNTGLTYAITAHISISLTGTAEWGRNDQSDVVDAGNREFNRQMISLGTQWKF
jgi:hypothetical protein